MGAPGFSKEGLAPVCAACAIEALCGVIAYIESSYSLAFTLTVQLALKVKFSPLNLLFVKLNGE